MPNELAANLTSFLVKSIVLKKADFHELKLEDDVERTSRCLFQSLEVRRIVIGKVVDGARTPYFLTHSQIFGTGGFAD